MDIYLPYWHCVPDLESICYTITADNAKMGAQRIGD